MSGQHHTPTTSLRKEHRYPLNRMLDGAQRRCERCEEEKKLLPLPGFEPRIVQLVA
jgi:hypothetical protein